VLNLIIYYRDSFDLEIWTVVFNYCHERGHEFGNTMCECGDVLRKGCGATLTLVAGCRILAATFVTRVEEVRVRISLGGYTADTGRRW